MIEANDVTGNSGTTHCSTVLNYGGGRQTVAMCVLIARGILPRPNVIVMADTDRENPSTWEYLEQHMKPYLAAHGMAVEIAPHSLATVDLYDNHGLTLMPVYTPTGKTRTYCSNEWKRRVVDRYLRSKGIQSGTRWIGFAFDEKRRWTGLHGKTEGKWTTICPLVDLMINTAVSALCYFYGQVKGRPLVGVSALRSKRPDAIRSILNREEMLRLFGSLSGIPLLAARMMYASGFRIGELGNLRIKDIDFARCQIQVCRGKHQKTRVVQFPECLHDHVRRQIESMRVLFEADKADGLNGVSLPDAYGRKCPSARMNFGWWYLLTADEYSRCPHTGVLYRHHRDMDNVARRIKEGCENAGITKRVTSHGLRHTFCTHSIESGVPIHFVQQLMGHDSIETLQPYIHASIDGATSAKSPLEMLPEKLAKPPLEEMLRNPKQPEAKPVLRVFAG